jgi:hypothetical protein
MKLAISTLPNALLLNWMPDPIGHPRERSPRLNDRIQRLRLGTL